MVWLVSSDKWKALFVAEPVKCSKISACYLRPSPWNGFMADAGLSLFVSALLSSIMHRSAQSLLKLDFARKISWSSPTLSPGPLPTHFLREKPWGRGWKFPPPPALLRNESWRHFKGMKNRSFYEAFLRRDLIGHVIDRCYHLFNNENENASIEARAWRDIKSKFLYS